MKSEIFQALGQVSAIFMSNPLPGTEQVMPEKELTEIGNKLLAYFERPWLGFATNRQLIDELRTRIEVNGGDKYGLDYRTVGYKDADTEVTDLPTTDTEAKNG